MIDDSKKKFDKETTKEDSEGRTWITLEQRLGLAHLAILNNLAKLGVHPEYIHVTRLSSRTFCSSEAHPEQVRTKRQM